MSESKSISTGKTESWHLERKEHIVSLTFTHMPRNFLNLEVLRELEKKLDEIERDKNVRVLIIKSGLTGVFMSGADMNSFKDNPGQIKAYTALSGELIKRLENLTIPVITAIDGNCLGGGIEFAIASDLCVATSISRFGQPEILYGFMPGGGRIRCLSRIFSKAQVKRLLLTGFLLSADEAFQMGLIAEVVVQGKLERSIEKISERLSSLSPLALGSVKKSVNASYENPGWEDQKLESDLLETITRSEDLKEGMEAYFNRRVPHFTGR